MPDGRGSVGGTPLPMIAILAFGYKSHISIDRRFGFIHEATVTSATAPDSRQLRHVVSTDNTASDVWADNIWADRAYQSQANETWLATHVQQPHSSQEIQRYPHVGSHKTS